jgi:hypothetical protein
MIRATKTQIEDFMESNLWLDILDEVTRWKDQAAGEYDAIVETSDDENPTTAKVLLHLGHIAGRRSTVDFVTGILDTILSMKIAEELDNNHS